MLKNFLKMADNGNFTWSSNCFEPIGRVVMKNE